MGSSLDYVKRQIESGRYGMENDDFSSIFECNTLNFLEHNGYINIEDGNASKKYECMYGNDVSFNLMLQYDPNADFESIIIMRCNCDGSLAFYDDLMRKCLNKIITLQSCDKLMENPATLNGYTLMYSIGDFVLGDEFGDKFTTKEKPWMQSRFTAMLPIKFKLMKKSKRIYENLSTLSKEQLIFIIEQYRSYSTSISEILVNESKRHIEPQSAIQEIRNKKFKMDMNFYDEHLKDYINMKMGLISSKEYRNIILGKDD